MIGFIVPVKSEKLSSDWGHFSKLVERSLKSISGQKDNRYKIIVVCHELPKNAIQHENISYVQVDFAIPQLTENDNEENRLLKERDKAMKIMQGFTFANENFDIDYFMVVDSDDCIHNGISKYVNDQLPNNIVGWYFKRGYFYREGKKMAFLNKKAFNDVCGSCIVIRKDKFKDLFIEEPYLYYHHEKMEFSDGSSLIPFPFPAAIYSMANGENHLMTKQNISRLVNSPKLFTANHVKTILSKLSKYRPVYIGNRFRKKFNFYSVD